ncbi:DUF1737 domain-containing protein [Massilia oculi]|uniref:DUF1737 domain-containing protein n=1 Tax=Massilia oculi TaxID=945844 RepID=UPI001AAE317D|nr:DUF1737 domain-containing protein [Massilia oculi]
MNKKITEYQLVQAEDPLLLEQEVREALILDWQPIGGISVVEENGIYTFTQAMVVYEDVDEDENS